MPLGRPGTEYERAARADDRTRARLVRLVLPHVTRVSIVRETKLNPRFTGVSQNDGVERAIDATVSGHFTLYLELGVNGHISKAKTARRGPLRRGCFYTGIPFPLRKYDGKGESGDQDNV